MSTARVPSLRENATMAPAGGLLDRVVQLLASGGDERIEIAPTSRKNKYGIPAVQTPEDVWLCSSTANPLSPRGLEAAANAVLTLEAADGGLVARSAAGMSDDVRRQISTVFGLPDGHAILAASGTDAELIALAIAKSLVPGPLTSIVIAPEETGSAVPKAALGCHFGVRANSGAHVATGQRMGGWEAEDIKVITVPIRDALGRALPVSTIDDLIMAHAEVEIAAGRGILLHVLDRSKTGLQAPSRAAARHLAQRACGRVVVLVDACQLRCGQHDLLRDLADGFIAMVTGSKFAGGSPFSGALLLPEAMHAALTSCLSLPSGMSAYSASADWPVALCKRVAATLPRQANAGLAARWKSALAELAPLAACPASVRCAIEAEFARTVDAAAISVGLLDPVDAEMPGGVSACATVRSFLTRHGEGRYIGFAEARSLHAGLQSLAGGSRVYLGQAVEIADHGALRVCLGAAQVVDVSRRMANGELLDRAFAPIAGQIAYAFDHWRQLARLL